MTVTDELLANNAAYAASFNGPLPLPPAAELSFPAALRWLSVAIPVVTPVASVNAAIAAIARLALLEDLTFGQPAMDPLISFAPLAALPQLRRHLQPPW